MKKTFGKIGLVSLAILFLCAQFFVAPEVDGYYTNSVAEFLLGPAILLFFGTAFWALLDMAFND